MCEYFFNIPIALLQAPMELGDGETLSPSVSNSTTDENSVELSEQRPETNGNLQQSLGNDASMETNDDSMNESIGGKKKKVSWAAEATLVSIHYFEMDESERSET